MSCRRTLSLPGRIRLTVGLAIGLALCLPAVAAPPPVSSVVHLQKDQILRGNFVQLRYMQGFSRPLKSTGHFTIAPKAGLIWQVEKPLAGTTVITRNGLMQKSRGVETLHLSAKKMPFVAQLYTMIAGLMTGDLSAMQQKFTLTRTGTAAHWQIRLVPRQKDDAMMPFSEIRASGGRFVNAVTMTRISGDKDELQFSGVTATADTLTPDEQAALQPEQK